MTFFKFVHREINEDYKSQYQGSCKCNHIHPGKNMASLPMLNLPSKCLTRWIKLHSILYKIGKLEVEKQQYCLEQNTKAEWT